MISPKVWSRYFRLRKTGQSMLEASKTVGISYASARAKEQELKKSSPHDWAKRVTDFNKHELPTEAIPLKDLKDDAKRALTDFAYFRRRYFGRLSTPWQEDAAYKVLNFLDTRQKEFVVINAPPGSGKSTLFTLDIPTWITVNRRHIRGMIGSASQTLAERYLDRLKSALESPWPQTAETEEIAMGLAVDAEATLIADYGAFRSQGALWRADGLVVCQHGAKPLTEKEPTWSAWGLDTAFIGGRYDICIWDDVVEEKHLITLEKIERHRDRWDKVAEKRLEPGGLLILQGQRLSPDDLYRYNLDKRLATPKSHDDCCNAEPDHKYHHVKYPAHYEATCTGQHEEEAPYWPEGCLIDPRRLSWVDLSTEIENSPGNFQQVYQQEDADPSSTLVRDIWVSGGTDPQTKEFFPGCWDNERGLCQLPAGVGTTLSVATTDPSPTKFWAVQWWCVATDDTEFRYLMDLERKAMQIGQFLQWESGVYTGLMEEWYQRSVDLGRPITHWVFEANAAQKFFLDTPQIRIWASTRNVQIIAHQTHRNKTDPKMGPQVLGPLYQYGKVRLPGAQFGMARPKSMKLVEEVKKWPKGAYEDEVMAQWFLEYNLENIMPSMRKRPPVTRWRPTWI